MFENMCYFVILYFHSVSCHVPKCAAISGMCRECWCSIHRHKCPIGHVILLILRQPDIVVLESLEMGMFVWVPPLTPYDAE